MQDMVPQVSEIAASSETGAVVFWSQSHKYLFIPPFPLSERRLEPGFLVAPVRDLLSRSLKVALVLVRLRAYAIGLCRDEDLIASKVGTGNIHARHRQGGSSQARFARHREKQIESFLTRVCGHAQEILGHEARSVDYIAYGGSHEGILLLRKQCSFLRQFDDRNLPALLDIEEPRQKVLERAVARVWSSGVVEWHDDAEVRVAGGDRPGIRRENGLEAP
ncbi:MAG: hypothetical protein HW414_1272 [Dehalococcoidia bacterium]|nr:hypothetical protein [Dehalococcoidia bacterium]